MSTLAPFTQKHARLIVENMCQAFDLLHGALSLAPEGSIHEQCVQDCIDLLEKRIAQLEDV